jgi:acyl carrier protein
MMANEIELRLRELLREGVEVNKPVEEIGFDEDLTSLGLNSISFIKLVVAVEDKFGVQFSDDDLDYNILANISSIASYIRKMLDSKDQNNN